MAQFRIDIRAAGCTRFKKRASVLQEKSLTSLLPAVSRRRSADFTAFCNAYAGGNKIERMAHGRSSVGQNATWKCSEGVSVHIQG